VLCDHSIISCSGVFVRQSSQMKNLSSKTNPHWCSWGWNLCLHISQIFSGIRTPPKPLPLFGCDHICLLGLYIKLFWMKRKKKRKMGCNRREQVAEMPVRLDWHVLRISRSINYVRAVFGYISIRKVNESIRWFVLKVLTVS
jgi:hypothetical protein